MSVVWWSRGKSLAFPGSRVRPSLARCARSFSRARCARSFSRPAAVVQAVCPGLALGASWPSLWGRLAPPGPLRGLWGAQQTPKSRPRATQERPRAAQEPPKSAQERPKSGQKRPKSAQEAPSSPKRLGRLIFYPFYAPLGEPRSLQNQQKVPYCRQKSRFSRFGARGPKTAGKSPKRSPRTPPARPKTCLERKRKAGVQPD